MILWSTEIVFSMSLQTHYDEPTDRSRVQCVVRQGDGSG